MANELNILLTTGLTVSAELYQGNTLSLTVNLAERGASGHYFNSTNITGLAAGNYLVDFRSLGASVGSGYLYWDGTKELLNKVDTDVALMRKLTTNTAKIDELTNRLIVYDDDGTTPILQFSTKNADGVDSTDQIFEIRKI
jgi:hypothetical protein